ncbi:MAG: hypothetical protein HKN23_03165 [Verrucomicrobiales bacterium]|nr:hypothetical protein [Verrucomicrobiales bacterium]
MKMLLFFSAFCFPLLLCAQEGKSTTDSIWVKPPSDQVLKNTPGLEHHTFESEAMGTKVGFCVVLPKAYKSESERRFPVVYWLHGGGGNESRDVWNSILWNELAEADEIEPVILVYPNGHRSGYMDHADGKLNNETMIIRELIPLIDQKFRTIPKREARAAHGFSMGSSGCLRFAIKYPDLFCSAVAYGGGAVDLASSKSQFILDILERNLNSEPKRIRQFNTYQFLEANHETVRKNGIEFLMVCGEIDSWMKSAETFQVALRAKNLKSELVGVPAVGHNYRKLHEMEGKRAAKFQDRVFQAGK